MGFKFSCSKDCKGCESGNPEEQKCLSLDFSPMNSEAAHTELRRVAARLAEALHEHDDDHPALVEFDDWYRDHAPWVGSIEPDDDEPTLLDDL